MGDIISKGVFHMRRVVPWGYDEVQKDQQVHVTFYAGHSSIVKKA